MWTNGPTMYGMFGFHGLLWLVLLAVIAVAIAALVRDRRHELRQDDALATLGLRYARGEIGRDEYLKLRQDLES